MLSSFLSFKRKFRKVLIAALVLTIVILLIVLAHVEAVNSTVVDYIPQLTFSNPLTYISDSYYSADEDAVESGADGDDSDESSDQIQTGSEQNYGDESLIVYKSFDEKHSRSSPYCTIIREMFTYLNELDITTFTSFNEVDALIEEEVLNHSFTPLKFHKSGDDSSNNAFELASAAQPYDLSPVFYWDILLQQIQDGDYIEFTWYDFISNTEYNNFLRNIHNATNSKEIYRLLDCSFLNNEIFDRSLFRKMRNPVFFYDTTLYDNSEFLSEQRIKPSEEALAEMCITIDDANDLFKESALKNFFPKILQTKTNFNVRPEVYHLQSTNRIFNGLEKPISVVLVNLQDSLFKQVFVRKRDTFVGENYVTNGVFDRYSGAMTQNREDILALFESVDFTSLDPKYTSQNSLHHLTDDDFTFDLKAKIDELVALREQGSLSLAQNHYLESLLHNYNSHYSSQKKYFTEVDDVINTYGKGFHHDHRFYRSQASANVGTFKLAVLQGMLKTFTAALKSLGIIGWISHGNMYGWMYNGLPFPYDDDIDFQLPLKHMHFLAEHFNQSVLMQDPRFGNGRYFLDFGNLGGRVHGAGTNNIDGRLLDMDTGLYIDITGLSFNGETVATKFYDELKTVLEENDLEAWNLEQDPSLSPLERMGTDGYKEWIESSDLSDDEKEALLESLQAVIDQDQNELNALSDVHEMYGELGDELNGENELSSEAELNGENEVGDEVSSESELYGKRDLSDVNDLNEHSDLSTENEHSDVNDVNEHIDLRDENKASSETDRIDFYIHNMTHDQRYAVAKKLGLVTCKNRHFVDVNDYKTLTETFYQQTPVIMPANYMDILLKEYTVPPEYAFLSFENYVFQPNMKLWLKKDRYSTAMLGTHYKPWNFMDDGGMSEVYPTLSINKTKNINSTLTLEETQIVLFNLCDFDSEITMDFEKFDEIASMASWANQFYQSEYRFREIALLNDDNDEKSSVSPSYLASSAELFSFMRDKMVALELHGSEKLYKDPYETMKLFEKLLDKPIYGYDMSQICRKHMFNFIQLLEDSRFNEVGFFGSYSTAGNSVWEIPLDDVAAQEVDSESHSVFLR